MEAGLLLLLLLMMMMMMGVFQAVETFCDGRQDGAQCVGALGGTVDIQLVDNAAEIPVLYWIKDASIIFRWRSKNNKTIMRDNRVTFIPSTGTVRINNLIRNDSGQYKLGTFNSNGSLTAERTLLLSVEAGVSSVQLVSECWSQGQMQVSCSSEEGDSPQYSWTLDGHTLTDSELFSGNNQTNIIVLRQNISGRLVCSVRNRVSESSREKDISTCDFIFINCTSNGTLISEWVLRENNTLCVEPTPAPTAVTHTGGPPSPLLICGLRFLLVVLLLLSICLYFTWRKKKDEKDKSSADSEDRDNSVMMVEMSSAS
ncbi:T-cell surface antigen CD2-like isoform X2 [Nothobranchius furzeri]|uniref:T-cell surface antigen CD2-like isoform X2 n=1 Tax=Nothobranchius furzeri TaxID=105023 RepID=UPI0039046F36